MTVAAIIAIESRSCNQGRGRRAIIKKRAPVTFPGAANVIILNLERERSFRDPVIVFHRESENVCLFGSPR